MVRSTLSAMSFTSMGRMEARLFLLFLGLIISLLTPVHTLQQHSQPMMKDGCIFTIASLQDFAYVRTLAQSVRSSNTQNYAIFWFVADDPNIFRHVDVRETLQASTYRELEQQLPLVRVISMRDLDEMVGDNAIIPLARRYKKMEFISAVKPLVFQFLFRLGFRSALFLGSELLITGSLHSVMNTLSRKSVVLVPRITYTSVKDMTTAEDHHHGQQVQVKVAGRTRQEMESQIIAAEKDEGEEEISQWTFDDRLFLQTGVYSTEFFGMANEKSSSTFLQWWREKLERYAHEDTEAGTYLDSKWVDLLPALIDHDRIYVVRDIRYNVGFTSFPYTAKHLQLKNGNPQIGNYSVVYMNYASNLLPVSRVSTATSSPPTSRLSRANRVGKEKGSNDLSLSQEDLLPHQSMGAGMRRLLQRYPGALEVLEYYTRLLLKNGIKTYRKIGYSFLDQRGETDDQHIERQSACVAVHGYYNAKSDPGRVSSAIYNATDAYCRLSSLSSHAFRYAFQSNDFELVFENRQSAWAMVGEGDQNGNGVTGGKRERRVRKESSDPMNYWSVGSQCRVNIFVLRPSHLQQVINSLPSRLLRHSITIGYFLWEWEAVPDRLLSDLMGFNHLWTPSAMVAKTFSTAYANSAVSAEQQTVQHVPVPILQYDSSTNTEDERRHSLRASRSSKRSDRASSGEKERGSRKRENKLAGRRSSRVAFVTIIDLQDGVQKKNIYGVMEAYKRAFGQGEPLAQSVSLHIVTSNKKRFEGTYEEILSKIEEIQGSSYPIYAHHYAELDIGHIRRELQSFGTYIYVSLHRVDSSGIVIYQHMAQGVPVIFTPYGAISAVTQDRFIRFGSIFTINLGRY